eukprot:gnl/Chilomastix_caulleri/839.p2 GENE.gnl/Chilomastix_caulleri/839~~gnl/Chilomastix_caulleri/839.p2  ORF type:complete len:177 (+),score=45.39 gnl/Chilomastix_caulleri/839:620-1150(+)
MAIHRVFKEETMLRCLDFCVAGGRYAPFYICCAIVDTTKLEEDEDVELGNKQDADRVLLSGLKYGYRNEEEEEYEYISKIIDRASQMMTETPPSTICGDALPTNKLFSGDIDKPWNLSMDIKPEVKAQRITPPRGGKGKVMFISLVVVGVVFIVITGYFGVKRLKALGFPGIGKRD